MGHTHTQKEHSQLTQRRPESSTGQETWAMSSRKQTELNPQEVQRSQPDGKPPGLPGPAGGRVSANGHRVYLGGAENVLELQTNDHCTTL